MFVGTKEVSLSFFLFCCSANSLALASSVKIMFFIFALKRKNNEEETCLYAAGKKRTEAPSTKTHSRAVLSMS